MLSVNQFEAQYPELVQCVNKDIIPEYKNANPTIVHAPVKSGKRLFVEYQAIKDNSKQQKRQHILVTAFHRKADKLQREELLNYGIRVFSGHNDLKKYSDFIKDCLKYEQVIVHLDECDFGSGKEQSISKFLDIKQNNCKFIYYSATPEEAVFSYLQEDIAGKLQGAKHIKYEPPSTFVGPVFFLENNLVREAERFFEIKKDKIFLTDQATSLVEEWINIYKDNKNKNILILRITEQAKESSLNSFYKYKAQLEEEFKNKYHKVTIKFDVTSKEITTKTIDWSDRAFWDDLTKDHLHIFVINQKSSRSTEWRCHDRVFAYHDFRLEYTYNTQSQAQERGNHYSSMYNGIPQYIYIYGHVPTMQLSAGQITYEQYKNKLSVRFDEEKRPIDSTYYETTEKKEHTNKKQGIYYYYTICNTFEDFNNIRKECKYRYNSQRKEKDGFIISSTYKKGEVLDLQQAIEYIPHSKRSKKAETVYIPCYRDSKDRNTLVHLLIFKSTTPKEKIEELCRKYNIQYQTIHL